jgi:hypothetical protein
MQERDSGLDAEIIGRHARGEPLAEILASYTDSDRQLDAAMVLAGLPDLRKSRRWRPLIWLLALFFALFLLVDILTIVDEGISTWWSISLFADGAICISLVFCQRWGFLPAPGWLLINIVQNLRAVLVIDTIEEGYEFIVEVAVLISLAALALWLKRLIFPYYAFKGPKLDYQGHPIVLREAENIRGES